MKTISKNVSYKNIKNIEVSIIDLCGNERVVIVPKNRVKAIIKDGLKCDGSSIYKTCKASNSDLSITLKNASTYFLPTGNLLAICHTDFELDARKNLLNFEKNFKKKFKINIGTELEFFMFKQKDEIYDLQNLDSLAYFEQKDNEYFLCLNEIVSFLNNNGIEILTAHHECGSNQFEINFKFDSPTKTADNIVYIKRVINYFAQKYNLIACFLPKPLENISGSGMHTNISIFKNKNNLFYDPKSIDKVSKFAKQFINNLFCHISSVCAIACPTKNSYDRLNAKMETPQKIVCSQKDRTALIRIPQADKNSFRIELRLPDVSCNPYLTFLSILKSGFDNKTEKKIPKKLPKTLKNAKNCLKNDEFLKNIVPNIFFV